MKSHEVRAMKNRILQAAVELIAEEGFQNLSMRKIASRMNISAPTIYYYYANKDELNIAIRKRAGEMLYRRLSAAYRSGRDVKEKGWRMVKAYLDFGLGMPDYYAIMFDSTAPKHSDYVGTELEEAAREELVSSMRNAELMWKILGEFEQAGYMVPDEIERMGMVLWSELHGLVSLHNNNLFREIGYPARKDVYETAKLYYETFLAVFDPHSGWIRNGTPGPAGRTEGGARGRAPDSRRDAEGRSKRP